MAVSGQDALPCMQRAVSFGSSHGFPAQGGPISHCCLRPAAELRGDTHGKQDDDSGGEDNDDDDDIM